MHLAISRRAADYAATRDRQAARAVAQDAALIGTRRLVHERICAKGLSLTRISRELGRSAGYLTTWLYRGTPKALPEDVLAGLATRLEVTPVALREQPRMGTIDALIADLAVAEISVRSPVTLRDVPLRKADRPLGWEGADCVHALRPAHLAQHPPAFAFITDDRHQWFPVGSCLYVDVDARPTGSDMVAVYRDGSITATLPLAVARDMPIPGTLWKIVAASFP